MVDRQAENWEQLLAGCPQEAENVLSLEHTESSYAETTIANGLPKFNVASLK